MNKYLKKLERITIIASLIVQLIFLYGCAQTASSVDPFEPVNRKVLKFNSALDENIYKPIARSYVNVIPEVAQKGIGNFSSNASYPLVFINQFLQGKFKDGAKDTARFLINTTIGLAGFIDVASTINLQENNEDFGQTLATWGLLAGHTLFFPSGGQQLYVMVSQAY